MLTQSQVDDTDVFSVLLSQKLFLLPLSAWFTLYSFYMLSTVLWLYSKLFLILPWCLDHSIFCTFFWL